MRLALLNWRDLTHPDGGGAERYAENVGRGLTARGHDVTLFCADHGQAPRDDVVKGVGIRRRGGRLGVYPQALWGLRELERHDGRFDAVIDVQNGLPFFAPLATRSPVVSLVHHVHREQWPVIFGRGIAAAGWTVESRLAPRLYRGRQYVAVSGRTRDELVELGVCREHIAVIHNGTDEPLNTDLPRAERPTIVVLGRLVPHKRVEHAIDVVAALRHRHPGLRLRVIGAGWWADRIRDHARARNVTDCVELLGFVDERLKHAELAGAWLALAPSVKEGWGLNVVEAASHGVPTIAYHGAGGLSESIEDGRTGLLVRSLADLTAAADQLLRDTEHRVMLGKAARLHARQFTWENTVNSWEDLLRHAAVRDAPMSATDAGLPFVRHPH